MIKRKVLSATIGFTADYRVKPECCSLRKRNAALWMLGGNITYANGTSFATPILAGLSVCLWQAVPELTPKEMIDTLQRPDISVVIRCRIGICLPDLYKAYKSQCKHVSER
jgi:subtilisin family serine protease